MIPVVAVNGPMEAGSRGARVEHARAEAIWLGYRVGDALAAAVGQHHPGIRVYRDRAAMDADFPLTRVGGFSAPRVGEDTRRRLRTLMWSFLVGVTALGCFPVAWLGLLAGGMAVILTGLA